MLGRARRSTLCFFALVGGLLGCTWVVPRRARAACTSSGEPSLAALSSAALRSSALEPARMRSLLRRARVAGLLPQVIVRVGRGAYDSVRNADSLDATMLSSDTLRYDITLRFSLDRLIFDAHELRAAEAAARMAEHRVALLERIAALWSERRRLDASPPALFSTTSASDPTDDARCTELTTQLDVLTGGALGSAAAEKSISLRTPPPRR